MPDDIYRRKCFGLTKVEQRDWVREAISHFFYHYQIFDMIDVDYPDPDPNSEPEMLEKTHGWILQEIGMNNLVSLIRPRVFMEVEEQSAIDFFLKKTGQTELTPEQLDKLDTGSRMPKLFRVRNFFNALVCDGIQGQPSIGKFVCRWLANSDPKQISCTLRMRKTLYDKGLLTKENDNPKDIALVYLDLFSTEHFKTAREKALAGALLSRGIIFVEIERVLKAVVVPPESEWQIKPCVEICGEYSFEIRRKDDPDNLFVGEINDCCMQIGHGAESSLFDSITNPASAILIVSAEAYAPNDPTRYWKPIGHSWLRKGKKSGDLYLDNVELVEIYMKCSELADAFVEWANRMKAKAGFNHVKIGKQYTALPISANGQEINAELYAEEFGKVSVYTDLGGGVWVL